MRVGQAENRRMISQCVSSCLKCLQFYERGNYKYFIKFNIFTVYSPLDKPKVNPKDGDVTFTGRPVKLLTVVTENRETEQRVSNKICFKIPPGLLPFFFLLLSLEIITIFHLLDLRFSFCSHFLALATLSLQLGALFLGGGSL